MSIARRGGGGEYLSRQDGRLPSPRGLYFLKGDRVIMRAFHGTVAAFWVPGETGTVEKLRGAGIVLVRLDSGALVSAPYGSLTRVPRPPTAEAEP